MVVLLKRMMMLEIVQALICLKDPTGLFTQNREGTIVCAPAALHALLVQVCCGGRNGDQFTPYSLSLRQSVVVLMPSFSAAMVFCPS